jgi:hypothetical protein
MADDFGQVDGADAGIADGGGDHGSARFRLQHGNQGGGTDDGAAAASPLSARRLAMKSALPPLSPVQCRAISCARATASAAVRKGAGGAIGLFAEIGTLFVISSAFGQAHPAA